MKLAHPLMLLTGVFGLMLPVQGASRDGEYLFDTLRKPAYRRAWDAMLRGQRVDPWLTAFARTRNGVSAPKKSVSLHRVTYQAGWVCKPHECGGNEFAVLFAPRGRKAWGLLAKDGAPERFFGSPPPEMRAALRKVIHE